MTATLAVTAVYDPRPPHVEQAVLGHDGPALYLLEWLSGSRRVVARDARSMDERWSIAVESLPGYTDDAFAVSPDETLLAYVRESGSLTEIGVFDRRDGALWSLTVKLGVESGGLRWTPDGTLLVVQGFSAVHVIDVARRTLVDEIRGVYLGAISPDASRYVVSEWEWLLLIERKGQCEISRWMQHDFYWLLALASDHEREAYRRRERVVFDPRGEFVWHLEPRGKDFDRLRRLSPGPDAEITLSAESVTMLQPTADGAVLVLERGDLRQFSVGSGGALVEGRRLSTGEGSYLVSNAYSPPACNARFAAFVHFETLSVVDLRTAQTRCLDSGAVPCSVVPSPDGATIAASWTSNKVEWLDGATLEPRMAFELEGKPRGCAFSPDGLEIYAVTHGGIEALRLDAGTSHRVAALTNEDNGRYADETDDLTISPGGRDAIVVYERFAYEHDRVFRIDLATGTAEAVRFTKNTRVFDAQFAQPGPCVHLLLDERDGTGGPRAVAVDLRREGVTWTRSLAQDLRDAGPGWSLRAARLTPGGDVALVTLDVPQDRHSSRLVRWTLPSGEAMSVHMPRGTLLALDDTCAAWFSQSAHDRTIVLIDLDTMALTARGPSPDGDIHSGCFTADGALIVGLTDGRVVRLEPAAAP